MLTEQKGPALQDHLIPVTQANATCKVALGYMSDPLAECSQSIPRGVELRDAQKAEWPLCPQVPTVPSPDRESMANVLPRPWEGKHPPGLPLSALLRLGQSMEGHVSSVSPSLPFQPSHARRGARHLMDPPANQMSVCGDCNPSQVETARSASSQAEQAKYLVCCPH